MLNRKTSSTRFHHRLFGLALFQIPTLFHLLLPSRKAYCYSPTVILRCSGSTSKDSSVYLSFGHVSNYLVSRTARDVITMQSKPKPLTDEETTDETNEVTSNGSSSPWVLGRLAKRFGQSFSIFSNGSSGNDLKRLNDKDGQIPSKSESLFARIRNRLPFRKEKEQEVSNDSDLEAELTEVFLAEVNEQTQKERLQRQKNGAMQTTATRELDNPEERSIKNEIKAMEQGQGEKIVLTAAKKRSSMPISVFNSTRSNKEQSAKNTSSSGVSVESSSFPSYIQSLVGDTFTSGLNVTQSFFYDTIIRTAVKLTNDFNKPPKGDDDNWVVACPKTRISPGEAVPIVVEGLNLLLIASNDAKQLYCVANQCPHLGTPLETGRLEKRPKIGGASVEQPSVVVSTFEDCIVCPLHHTAFALDSGEVRGEWCPYPPIIGSLMGVIKPQANLPIFAVRVKGKNIEVRLNSALNETNEIENYS
jgi:nitrite reductase/ring-hydroxylating ferredoxin subunit